MAAARDLHLGLRPDELASSPLARFYRPDLAPLSASAREAIAVGPVAHELLPPIARAGELLVHGHGPVETGYSLAPDGGARIAVHTPMPGVTPAMWDWWFGWHGSEAARYKLWHPRAHVHAAWADGAGDLGRYVGRTSQVVEYIGSTRMRLDICFVPPSSVGLDPARLAQTGAVAICARAGLAGAPAETGWLIHHVRPISGGSEMRSRFWVAGETIRAKARGPVGAVATAVLRRLARPNSSEAAHLLVHCAQEMAHLAAILPDLHAAFAHKEPTP
jgi:DAPG hydrolase PhiG domain